MLKNGLHGEAPVKWTAYLPPAWTLTEYRLHADPMFLPNPTGQSRFIAQKQMLSLCRRLVLASIARSAPGITSCSSQTWEQGRRIHAQTRNPMPRSWTRTSGRPSQRNPSWYKSARPMVSRRKAAPRFRETSMSKSGRRSPRRKKRPPGRNSRRASTPPRPSSPKASKRANSERSATAPRLPGLVRSTVAEHCGWSWPTAAGSQSTMDLMRRLWSG
jgi:hypothetical protein